MHVGLAAYSYSSIQDFIANDYYLESKENSGYGYASSAGVS